MRVPIPRLAPSVRALTISVLVVASLGFGGPEALGRGPSRPNVLLLFADDQRADTIAAWGNPHIRTPNLDRLVRRGSSFRSNYCFGSNSGAVCVPSRAMLMSGRTWLDVQHDLDGVTLLPELLREARLRDVRHRQVAQRRAVVRPGLPRRPLRLLRRHGRPHQGPGRRRDATARSSTAGSRRSSPASSSPTPRSTSSGRDTGDGPFFCYVAFTAPHDPRNPPEPYREMYYRDRPPLPANFLPAAPVRQRHHQEHPRREPRRPTRGRGRSSATSSASTTA